ncbi:hypothetical protein ONS95_006495 [Cadophora gregata]|uniref:uncharacterized protein n=1 Tax=Cadophora gregata TaxID=51156 RepID=UPI0026DCBF60|nr:uncharacterized protein ONS95_006495 [Cadophora gregata]KAK0101318.1 hypothetical protein ONS95_006495 [Cadophora gregata]KAK0106670.1 hypothetical protein ONS96_004290 [Cadophora gregata f. sp. sojae]
MDVNLPHQKDDGLADESNNDPQMGLVSLMVKKRKKYAFNLLVVIGVQLLIILVLGVGLVVLAWRTRPTPTPNLSCPPLAKLDVGIISPARDGVRYHEKTLYEHRPRTGPYLGRPNTEINTAWADLTRPSYVQVTRDELEEANLTSMVLPKGTPFTTINVYHHLHCLRAIKRYIYAPYYHPDVSVEDIRTDDYSDHIDHCVDLLRETIMCQPDFSLATFEWAGAEPRLVVQNGKTTHQCVDWPYFEEWAKGRALDVQMVLDYWATASGAEFTDV